MTVPEPATRASLPPVEVRIAADLARHGIVLAPAAALVAALFGGWAGAAGATLGVVVVVANFLVAGVALGWAARISPGVLMGTAFGGYLLRLGALAGIFFAVRSADWIDLEAFGFSVAAAVVVLLVWEARVVSGWMARPWEGRI